MIDEYFIGRVLARAAWRMRRFFPDNVITVAEASHPCLRWAYLSRRRQPKPTGYEALLHLGNALHEIIESELRREGYETEVRVALNLDGVKIVGRADAVKYEVTPLAEEVAVDVLELKTVDGVPEKPREHHVMQLQAYLNILGAEEGHIVYVDRAKGRIKVFKVRRDPKALEEIKRRAKQLHEHLTKGEEPPPRRGPWCSYCPYYWACMGGGYQ